MSNTSDADMDPMFMFTGDPAAFVSRRKRAAGAPGTTAPAAAAPAAPALQPAAAPLTSGPLTPGQLTPAPATAPDVLAQPALSPRLDELKRAHIAAWAEEPLQGVVVAVDQAAFARLTRFAPVNMRLTHAPDVQAATRAVEAMQPDALIVHGAIGRAAAEALRRAGRRASREPAMVVLGARDVPDECIRAADFAPATVVAALDALVLDVQRRQYIARLEDAVARSESANASSAALVDPATGFYPIGMFRRVFTHEVRRARRYGDHLGLVHASVDNFAMLAAKVGPGKLDPVLAQVANAFRRCLRDLDIPVRGHNADMMVVLPHTPPAGVAIVAKRLVERVSALRVRIGSTRHRLRLSVGMAGWAPGSDQGFAELLRAARDAARTAAAQGGGIYPRDTPSFASPESPALVPAASAQTAPVPPTESAAGAPPPVPADFGEETEELEIVVGALESDEEEFVPGAEEAPMSIVEAAGPPPPIPSMEGAPILDDEDDHPLPPDAPGTDASPSAANNADPVDPPAEAAPPADDPAEPAGDSSEAAETPADGPEAPADDPADPTELADDPAEAAPPADEPAEPAGDSSDAAETPADGPEAPADEPADPAELADDPAEAAPPADDPAPPADDPAEPADDPAQPADEPAEPADDPAQPADDPAQPAEEPVKPPPFSW